MLNYSINNETGGSANFLPVSPHKPIFRGYEIMDENTIPSANPESQITKKCTKCGEEKPATKEFFYADKQYPSGIRPICKICSEKHYQEHKERIALQRKEHYRNNRERILTANREKYAKNYNGIQESTRERYQKNRDRNLITKRLYHNKNREKANAISRRYHAANRDLSNAKRRDYYVNHRAETNEKDRIRGKERHRKLYGKDPSYTLRTRISALLRYSLKHGGKSKSLNDILDYSIEELRAHIESLFTENMSWDSFMRGEIHIDHIRPISSFNIESIDDQDFKECWAISNLRPLWAFDNLSKGSKYNG